MMRNEVNTNSQIERSQTMTPETETKNIVIPKADWAEEESSGLLKLVEELEIKNDKDLAVASRIRENIAGAKKKLDGIYDPFISQFHKLHKQAIATKAKYGDPLDQGDRKAKGKMEGYYEKIEQERLEAARKAQLAREKAEQDRKAEEERLAKEAEEEEEAGNPEKAEELIQQAAEVERPAPVLTPFMPARPQVAGASARKLWSAEVVDFMELVKAVAEGRAPKKALVADQKFLDGRARTDKQDLDIPGVTAISRTSVARI